MSASRTAGSGAHSIDDAVRVTGRSSHATRRTIRALLYATAMDARELLASRSYWLMLLAVSALVGQAFISAVELYAEASGAGGGPAALSQGLSPLEGVLVPTFGAYDLAATLLFPFVAIRLLSQEKQTGAHWLTLQAPVNFSATVFMKGAVLLVAWMLALLPGLSALVVWHLMGGHLHAPETAGLLLGYVLRGVTTIGICAVASALSASAASAAVVALAFTIGTWALDYLAAAKGGVVATIASYTPWAALRTFEHGELRANTVCILLVLGVGGVAFNAMASPSGRTTRSRVMRTAVACIATIIACMLCAQFVASADVSENRRNSFAIEDQRALATISGTLTVTVFLSPEDPRLVDLEHGVLAKLRRAKPDTRIGYMARGRTGLFENDNQYGEVWYELGGKRLMTRSSIEEVVLETIYQLAGRAVPNRSDTVQYPGYPLRAESRWAPWIFFVAWPLLISFAWFASQRRTFQRA